MKDLFSPKRNTDAAVDFREPHGGLLEERARMQPFLNKVLDNK